MAQSPKSPRSLPSTQAAGDPKRVLVLEDERAICDLIAKALKPRGWTLKCVPDSLRGFQELEAFPYRAVVADERLPQGSTGHRFLADVRRLCPAMRLVWLAGAPAPLDMLAELNAIGAVPLLKGEARLADIVVAIEGPPDAA